VLPWSPDFPPRSLRKIHEGGAAIRPADGANKGSATLRVKPTRADWLLPPLRVRPELVTAS